MRPYAGRAGRAGPIFSRTSVTAGRQDGARHQADATDPCRTSGLRRAGKRGSTRSNTSWRCWKMRRSSHQPTFCNLARCRRPWPQRRGGACRSMQQQDRAIRAGGAPVRGKSERRADGAAIDWRTAGCINRRRPRSNAPSSRRKRHSRRPWRAPSVSINKEIELGVRGRWPPLSECTICSDPASRSSSCREVGCAALQTIRREYAAPPHGAVPSRSVGFLPIPGSSHVLY